MPFPQGTAKAARFVPPATSMMAGVACCTAQGCGLQTKDKGLKVTCKLSFSWKICWVSEYTKLSLSLMLEVVLGLAVSLSTHVLSCPVTGFEFVALAVLHTGAEVVLLPILRFGGHK